jgi:cell division transport system permease protein
VVGVAAVVAVLLTGGTVAGGFLMMRDEPAKPAPSAGEERDVAVFFCVYTSSIPHCGRRDADEAQKTAVRQRLEGMPEVRGIRYESKEQAYENFKKAFADRKDLLEAARPGGIPDSLRVRVADIGTAQALKTELESAPGVDTVVIQPLGKV